MFTAVRSEFSKNFIDFSGSYHPRVTSMLVTDVGAKYGLGQYDFSPTGFASSPLSFLDWLDLSIEVVIGVIGVKLDKIFKII